jgi:hypothetical protein
VIRAASLAAAILAALCLTPAAAQADFGLLPGAAGFQAIATADGGELPDEQAGSHPYSLVTEVNFKLGPESPGQPGVPFSDGDLRDLQIDLPPGLIENPTAVSQCTQAQFRTPRNSPLGPSLSGESCPPKSQIGTIEIRSSLGGGQSRTFGVFNLAPRYGFPSQFGFGLYGAPVTISPHIRETDNEYGLSLSLHNFPQQVDLLGFKLVIWGAPWSAAHDGERGNCLNEAESAFPYAKCSVGPPRSNPHLAYLTMPTSCGAPLVFGLTASSWQQPGSVSASSQGAPLRECDTIRFEPLPLARLNTPRAGSPSGLEFEIQGDTDGLLEPERRASSQVKKAVVRLPAGMTINPSLGAGLGVCTPAQYAAETVTSPPGAGCPDAATIGELRVQSPLFKGEIEGGLYLAQPDDPESPGAENPFDSLLALYLIAKSPERGVMVRLAGKVSANPDNGQLTTTFDGLPQLPYSRFTVHFRDGQRTPLATPATCGSYQSLTEVTPWLDPTAKLSIPSEFPIVAGIGGGPCPTGIPPFHPAAVAGTLNRNSGSYTPYYLHLTRTDAEQEITSYSAKMPPGLLGKIRGIPYCPEAAIANAKLKSGFGELREPSCPASSSIGHTVSGYGLGSVLAYAPGGLYLAGPYHGAPISIVAIDSATVGPFDLGVVIVRSAIRIDPRTAQVSVDSAGSDPIPHIFKGIPLHLRDIRIYLNRPNFTLNPTSCERFSAESSLNGSGASFASSADDSTATASSPFQVSNCSARNFEPRLGFTLKGPTKRGNYPSLRAVVRPRPGDANIAKAAVALPPSLFLAQEHIETICTQAQFAAQRCPAGSRYGWAKAVTPLLGQPMEGPVYLRSSANPLPDLVADITGAGVRIEVGGRIDSVNGGIRGTFDFLPDAPVTKFTMSLMGGKHGLLVNSEDLCASRPTARALMVGKNNAVAILQPRLAVHCPGHHARKRGKR